MSTITLDEIRSDPVGCLDRVRAGETLLEHVRRVVADRTGIVLETEVRIIGDPL